MARQGRKDRGLFQRTLKDGTLVWAVRLSVNGKLQQFSPFATKAQARAFYDNSKTEQRQGRFFPAQHSLTGPDVQSYLDRYLLTISQKKTGKEERVFADWWGIWYEGRSLSSITAEDLELARRELLTGLGHCTHRPRTPARVNRYVSWLHHVFEHPVNFQYMTGRDPVKAVKPMKEIRKQRQTISPDLERKLIERLEVETPGITHAVALAVMVGIRQGEEFTRRKTEVDTEHWILTIPDAKHLKQPKVVPLIPSVRPSIHALLSTPGPWLVPHPDDSTQPFPIKTWYKTKFRRAVKAVGLPVEFNWHSFRHTFATRMLMNGSNTQTVALAGGWKSERMVSQVYGHLSRSFVSEAMERAANGSGTVTGGAPHEK